MRSMTPKTPEMNGNGHVENAEIMNNFQVINGHIDNQTGWLHLNEEFYGADIRVAENLAQRFSYQADEAYSSKLHGEPKAKEMLKALLVTGAEDGMAGVVMGPPGGGKSLVTEYGHTVIHDIAPSHIASVPHRQDLTPAQLTGDVTKMEKSTTVGGETFTDEITARVIPIIKSGTKVVQFDEGNRTSPLAINAGLKIMQDGRVEVVENGEIIEVSELDLVLTAMNNYGTAFTNKLDPAFIARHGMGVFMNERSKGELTEGANWRWDNPQSPFRSGPFPGAMYLHELHTIRRFIPAVQMNKGERELGKRLEIQMLDYLRDEKKMNYADTRPADQLVRITQALTLLRGKEAVTEEELRNAVTYWMVARLGMTGKISSNAEAEKIVDSFN